MKCGYDNPTAIKKIHADQINEIEEYINEVHGNSWLQYVNQLTIDLDNSYKCQYRFKFSPGHRALLDECCKISRTESFNKIYGVLLRRKRSSLKRSYQVAKPLVADQPSQADVDAMQKLLFEKIQKCMELRNMFVKTVCYL